MAFRKLDLPKAPEGSTSPKGEVYLHSMPGRRTRLEDDCAEIASRGITTVLRLTSDSETREMSDEYLRLIEDSIAPWEDLHFPIRDFGVPDDYGAFVGFLRTVESRLDAGRNILIHCAAGVGRTGTVAAAILVMLGVDLEKAVRTVARAGSHAEAEAQVNLLKSLAEDFRPTASRSSSA